MNNSKTYKIRPAGRHILTIGRDLIQNQYAAIVELVKNAYDADSPDVLITFKVPKARDSLTIIIEDHGHGMSQSTLINSWLVPSTTDKLDRRESPKGRVMQGQKGIGRYAASILGNSLLLETISEGVKSEICVEWDLFKKARYLEDVDLLLKTEESNKQNGTKLTIKGNREYLSYWDKKQIDKLIYELKKLISPVSSEMVGLIKEEPFNIFLDFDGFWKEEEYNVSEQIKSYPITDYYDYKISGLIDNNGKGELTYTNQKARNTIVEKIPFEAPSSTSCGHVYFDFRVYDRDKDSIELLIKRGLKDEIGNYVGKLQAKALINQYNGIGVYRHGFRIRPMGDPGFDWLELDTKRVQNPSMRIGSNQIIGFILIRSEDISGLEEKSARDGLRENQAYFTLKKIALKVLGELESRRFAYRNMEGLGRKTLKVERALEKLFEFDDLKESVRKRLVKDGVPKETTQQVLEFISKKEEANNKIAEEIRREVAIYQGQATLGKIVNVILHEGRKPLHYINNQVPNIHYWSNKLKLDYDQELLNKILDKLSRIEENVHVFSSLFSRLDPLAAAKRGAPIFMDLADELNHIFEVFESEFRNNNITYNIDCPKELYIKGWRQDIYTIFTNLIDNIVYWMVEKQTAVKHIRVTVSYNENELDYIDYKDSGPGIEPRFIESESIFEPSYTTKENGFGLGLPIAGEAASRNNFELKAFEYDKGAYFRLQSLKDEEED
jgi:signal transduction histidine kinase